VFVLAPRSIKFAPSETTPSGILKTPDATPDKIERIVPTSSISLYLVFYQHELSNAFSRFLYIF
jgi:hypothetical protein